MLNTVIHLCKPASECCPDLIVTETGIKLEDPSAQNHPAVALTDAQFRTAVREWAQERSNTLDGRTPVIQLMSDVADVVEQAVTRR